MDSTYRGLSLISSCDNSGDYVFVREQQLPATTGTQIET